MDDNNTYQNGSYQQGNAYQNGDYQQNNAYQNGDYQQNNTYQNNDYMNGNYPNNNRYQQYQQYQPYGNVQPNNDNGVELEEPVKVSEWLLSMVLMFVPCVNIIMMFVWAFSSSEKKSKSNFFKASLIVNGIMMVLMILFSFAMIFMSAYILSLY